MRRRHPLMLRRPGEWIARAGLALLAVALGTTSVRATLGLAGRTANPVSAHAYAPWDGRVTAQLAEKRFVERPTATPDAPAAALARLALRQDATAVTAVSTLGLQTQMRGDVAGARRLFAYAQKLSRRDLQSQVWAIEEAVSRGDVSGALGHYDIALRTSARAPELLFPILANAIGDPRVRSALVRTLGKRPSWSPLFVEYLAMNGPDLRATADVLGTLGRQGQPVSNLARALLTERLVSQNFPEDAWRFYASFRAGARRDASRDPGFRADLSDPTVLDWQSVAVGGAAASVQSGLIDFSTPASVGGALVRQFQLLPPGTYRLTGHSMGIAQPDSSLPYWILACRDGRELGRIVVPASSTANGAFSGTFRVPGGCPVQSLSLVARASDASTGSSGQFDRIALVPLASRSGAAK